VSRVFLLSSLAEVPAEAPVLRADDLGVLRGESVFETLRIAHGQPLFLPDHLARMAASAERVDIALPEGFAELAAVASAGAHDASLRLVCSKGVPGGSPVGFAVVAAIGADIVSQRSGVSAVTLPLGVAADFRSGAPWALGGVKSTSYAVNMATLRAAHEQGADDAVWVSTDGWVLEAPTATVLALVDGGWVTPPASVGILPGTTLIAVQALVDVTVRPLLASELVGDVALLSSVRGVAPVLSLDGRVLPAEGSRSLQKAYEEALPS
jgi:4-amino-4-deoxychorismate lyase